MFRQETLDMLVGISAFYQDKMHSNTKLHKTINSVLKDTPGQLH